MLQGEITAVLNGIVSQNSGYCWVLKSHALVMVLLHGVSSTPTHIRHINTPGNACVAI